jgi:hypothetical protein
MQAAITIGKRAFFVSFFALLTIIVFAGILSYTVPPGSYESTLVDGVEVIDPDSYQRLDSVDFPVWKIIAARCWCCFLRFADHHRHHPVYHFRQRIDHRASEQRGNPRADPRHR